MKAFLASLIRRPITQKERVAWLILFFILVVGVRYFAPQFRPAMTAETLPKPGMQIVDDVLSGLPQSVLHAESVLTFDPAEVRIRSRGVLTLTAMVDTGGNRVTGAELSVRFDPTKLKLERITASPAFALNLQPQAIDNQQGTGSIALGVPLEQSAVSGRQSIAVLTFRALATVGNTEVTFAENTLLAADDEPGNVIRERQAARVSIAAR
ncbi:MAG: cohesin domain-containing protein [Candidatus Moraniibacteriota bacterium]